jgi:hypothetical protein
MSPLCVKEAAKARLCHAAQVALFDAFASGKQHS